MKTTVCIAMILLISTFAINPAFGIIDGRPDGTGDVANALSPASAGYSNQFGPDPEVSGAPNSGDGIPDGSGWDSDDPGASNSYPLFLLVFPIGAL